MQFLVVHKIALLLVAAAVVGVAAYMRHGKQSSGAYPVSPYSSTPPGLGGAGSLSLSEPYGGTTPPPAPAATAPVDTSAFSAADASPVPDAVTTAAVAPDATSSSVYDGTQPASTSSYVGGGGPAGTVGPGGVVPIRPGEVGTSPQYANAYSWSVNPALFDAPTTITPVAVPGTKTAMVA